MLRIGFYGREEFFSEKFKPFLSKDRFENIEEESSSNHELASGQRIEVLYGIPPIYSNGKLLLKNKELEVLDLAGIYELHFPTMKNIQKVYVTKDAGYAQIYCSLEAERADETEKKIYCENLFHLIRHVFLLYAQKNWILCATFGLYIVSGTGMAFFWAFRNGKIYTYSALA